MKHWSLNSGATAVEVVRMGGPTSESMSKIHPRATLDLRVPSPCASAIELGLRSGLGMLFARSGSIPHRNQVK